MLCYQKITFIKTKETIRNFLFISVVRKFLMFVSSALSQWKRNKIQTYFALLSKHNFY
jgi:hypothetical protein